MSPKPILGGLSFIELGVEDPERARVFFHELLGWDFVPFGDGSMIEGPGFAGGLHGGDPGGGIYTFFAVEDMEMALKRVHVLGGSVEQEVAAEDGPYGRFILCRDDQGTTFGLHQPPPPSAG